MKTIKLTIVCLLLSVASVGSAWAGGSHHHRNRTSVGIMIGPSWGPSFYSPFPYYYPPYYPYSYPPVVIERQAPQVYIEQQQAPAPSAAPVAAAPINYWYFCAATNAYYPYVKECSGGWQKILPQPPGQN